MKSDLARVEAGSFFFLVLILEIFYICIYTFVVSFFKIEKIKYSELQKI